MDKFAIQLYSISFYHEVIVDPLFYFTIYIANLVIFLSNTIITKNMKLHNHFSSFDANTQIRWDSQNFIIIILIKHVMYYQLYKISLQSISIYYIFSSVLIWICSIINTHHAHDFHTQYYFCLIICCVVNSNRIMQNKKVLLI